jgi:hypothetical protein
MRYAFLLRIFYHGTDGMILRFLAEPSPRETFESAHSVILAICASHAQQQQLPRRPPPDLLSFVPRMVPFYAQCLIEVSWQS